MSGRRSWVLVSGFLAITIAALGLSAYSGASSSQGFAPPQPVDFPHPRHVQQLGMNCLYCHYAANKSPDPGLPAVGTCMGCHNIIPPTRSEIEGFAPRNAAAIAQLLLFAPQGTPAEWQPIPWVRIHKLPEYVHFPHMRHVNAGVTCQTCHGPVQEMQRVYQYASLNMGWCVNCHVKGYKLADGLLAAGDTAGAQAAANVEPKKARYDCAVCHY
ncbi:MAG TPA: cytochrome c3 family protein [Gemmatimonadaceae bacterium]